MTIGKTRNAGQMLMAFVLFILVVSLWHSHVNSIGVHVDLTLGGLPVADIGHVFVITSSSSSSESERRRKAFRYYLEGVDYTEIVPSAGRYGPCDHITEKEVMATSGHLRSLELMMQFKNHAEDAFYIIFEDDMCPSKNIGRGEHMINKIARALVHTDPAARAVNIGPCNGRRLSMQASTAAFNSECMIFRNFPVCTHAWAIRRAHVPAVISLVKNNICKKQIDIILADDSDTVFYQNIVCMGLKDSQMRTPTMFFHNMIRQCAEKSIINS